MARTGGQQARRAGAACTGPPTNVVARAGGVGPVGHARQSGTSHGCTERCRHALHRHAGSGPPAQAHGNRHVAACRRGTVSLGGPPGHGNAAACGPRVGKRSHRIGVSQHAVASRALVSGGHQCPTGMGRVDRAASWLIGSCDAGLGRDRAQAGFAQGRVLHIEPGLGRGFPPR